MNSTWRKCLPALCAFSGTEAAAVDGGAAQGGGKGGIQEPPCDAGEVIEIREGSAQRRDLCRKRSLNTQYSSYSVIDYRSGIEGQHLVQQLQFNRAGFQYTGRAQLSSSPKLHQVLGYRDGDRPWPEAGAEPNACGAVHRLDARRLRRGGGNGFPLWHCQGTMAFVLESSRSKRICVAFFKSALCCCESFIEPYVICRSGRSQFS